MYHLKERKFNMKYPVYYDKNSDKYFMVINDNYDDDNVILFDDKTKTVLHRLICNKLNCSLCKVYRYLRTHFDEEDEMRCQDIIVGHPEMLAESFPNIVYCGSCYREKFDYFVIHYKTEMIKSTKHENVDKSDDTPDYKKRMQTEYRELKERYDKLHNMIVKYEAGTLDFEPNCTIDILKNQKSAMGQYLYWLEVRAQIENVEL